MHLSYIHRLRGVAIFAIVGVHCLESLDWSNELQGFRLGIEILQGSTILFFMISGLLFQHLSRRMDYADYLRRKFLNVLLPYLFISIPGIVRILWEPTFIEQNPEMAGTPLWMRVAFLYLYGGSQANHALWFVPVMCVLYLLAPLFWWVLKHPRSFAALFVLLPMAFVEHRPLPFKYHNLALVLYFMPAYMLGMWIGLHRDRVIAFTQRYAWAIVAVVIAITAGHLGLTDYVGGYVGEPFSGERGLIDWIYVQKILVFVLLMTALKPLDRKDLPALDYIATCSFGIYFVHMYVLNFLTGMEWISVKGGFFSMVWVTGTTMGLSLVLVHAIRKLFGRRSRMLIGS